MGSDCKISNSIRKSILIVADIPFDKKICIIIVIPLTDNYFDLKYDRYFRHNIMANS